MPEHIVGTPPGAAVPVGGVASLGGGGPAPGGDQLPSAAVFWQWVWRSVRPTLGWILVGIGALAIILGWFGVSGESLVAKQLPYVISGGIFGLAFVALGTFFLATEEMRRDSHRLDRVERMVRELHAVLLTRPDAPPPEEVAHAIEVIEETYGDYAAIGSSNGGRSRPTGRAPGGQPHAASGHLVALPDGHRFHRPECRMVAGKPGLAEVSTATIRRRHMEPCNLCEPVLELSV